MNNDLIEDVKEEETEEVNLNAFKTELEDLINSHGIENIIDVPDFLLAEMIVNFVIALKPIKKVLDWHGCDSVCHPKKDKKEK